MITGTTELAPVQLGPVEQPRARWSFLSRLFGGSSRPVYDAATLEQRERMRHSLHGAAALTELDDQGMPGRSWPVEILNLSRGGAAVSSTVFVAPGTAVMVQFPAEGGAPPRHLMARVVHIRRLDELVFAVGLKFDARARGGRGGSR